MLFGLGAALNRIAQISQALDSLGPAVSPEAAAAGGQRSATHEPAPAFGQVLHAARSTAARPRTTSSPSAYDDLIARAAARHGVDADLVHAVVKAESSYNPRCRSSAGAIGLMQLMPGTARALGVGDPWDAAQNLDGGVRYLRQQLDRFGEVDLALAAYNAGPGAVQRHHGIPPYRETQTYVKRVLQTLWDRKGD